MGPLNLPSAVPYHASQMYAKNIATFLKYLVKDGKLTLDREDDIVRETLVTFAGEVVHERVKEFFVLLLILESAMIGVFLALDLFLFYVFWEATLIPMALLIGMYGHERRVYAAVKFFLYTMVASMFMLAATIYL